MVCLTAKEIMGFTSVGVSPKMPLTAEIWAAFDKVRKLQNYVDLLYIEYSEAKTAHSTVNRNVRYFSCLFDDHAFER